MSFRTIRHAQQKAWPEVLRSIGIHQDQRDRVRRDPSTATTAAKARANRGWHRVIADETVWALAKAGLLLGEEQAAVLEAAKAWAKSWPDGLPPDDSDDETDRELYAAIQTLATTLDPNDDEELTQIELARTVPPITKN